MIETGEEQPPPFSKGREGRLRGARVPSWLQSAAARRAETPAHISREGDIFSHPKRPITDATRLERLEFVRIRQCAATLKRRGY